MNVLAKRANGIFIAAPILVASFILLNLILYNLPEEQQSVSLQLIFGRMRYGRTNPLTVLYLSYTYVTAASVMSFIIRLFVCKTIIEYDDCGIYIYRKFRPVETVRYENLWTSVGTLDDKDTPSILESGLGSEGVHSARGIRGTGTLKIKTNKKVIYLYGVGNVLQVEKALNSLIEENRRQFIKELYTEIEKINTDKTGGKNERSCSKKQ